MPRKKPTISDFVSQFLGQQNTLSIPRAAIVACDGDHLTALALSQIVYWSHRTDDKDGWFAKSYEDWHDELLMSQYQMSRAVKKLREWGVVETKRKKSKYYEYAPTLHYRVNTAALEALFSIMENEETRYSENQETQQSENEETRYSLYTEITSENTAESTPRADADAPPEAQPPSDDEIVKKMIYAYESGLPAKPMDNLYKRKIVREQAVKLWNEGIQPSDLTEYTRLQKSRKFWSGQIVPWKFAAENVRQWIADGKPTPHDAPKDQQRTQQPAQAPEPTADADAVARRMSRRYAKQKDT